MGVSSNARFRYGGPRDFSEVPGRREGHSGGHHTRTARQTARAYVPQRIFGTVDYKKARYIILPDQTIRQALFVDSKAEKSNATATIQMSQSSMLIRQQRGGREVEEAGSLPKISEYAGRHYLTTTALLHFKYTDIRDAHHLQEVTLTAIPNGMLQDKYNPNATETIWLAGRNAPSRGEDFRVRLGFSRLREKCPWRVQKIAYDDARGCQGAWHD